ncbi:hypothetical protein EJ07DRAFT_135623 [Lizonia empirigonia]|nr:hypothetical protein EJ07DRAFT_135623 [Lizonia empirigonia]
MESIVSKVRAELVDLAVAYADAGHENVTLSLISDFQHVLFPLLDERVRINDLEQSDELRDEMIQLFGDEHPTKPAWPYLDQLDMQDRCFAQLGCRFKHGAALYKSSSCKEHFVCKNHQWSPCLAKHKQITKGAADESTLDETVPLADQVEGKLEGAGESKEKTATINTVKEENPKSDGRTEIQVCQLRMKSGEVMWVPMEDYLQLKHKYAMLASSDEDECDDDIVNREGMNQQNADIGRQTW